MRDIAPFGLRMPIELRARVQREAEINRRSLNAEINNRLESSLHKQAALNRGGYVVQSPENEYAARTDPERAMLATFRSLPTEKQLALLSLFK